MTKTGKRRAKTEAQKLVADLNSAPVSVERIAKVCGATIQFAPLDAELSGMVFQKEGVPTIGVNALHHPHRQRFTIAHEIGHIILHSDRIKNLVHVDKVYPVLYRDKASAAGVDLMEIEANAFAAELLMPQHLLPADDLTHLDIDDDEKVTNLAKRFNVSTSAMRYRLLGYFSD